MRDVLKCIYITMVIVATYSTSKLVNAGFAIFTAGVIPYALTYTVTDIVAEVYGKGEAKKFVKLGFAALILMFGLNALLLILPTPQWYDASAFERVAGQSLRVIIASMAAYIVSQTHDIHAFEWWRDKTNGKHLWLRNNASTFISQLIDTCIFITVAFYGVVTMQGLINLIFSEYLAKVFIAALDTGAVYVVVKYLLNRNG